MRKFLLSASLAGLLLAAVPVFTHAISPQSSPGQQSEQQATKTISGKVTSIGNGGHSFALEVSQGSDKQTMQFIVDKNAKVQGKVGVGTDVTVEYTAMEGGQNLALSITANA